MSNPTKSSVEYWERAKPADGAAEPAEAVTRRRFLGGTGVAAVGAALGGTGLGFPQLLRAEAAGLDLPAELSEGARAAAVLDTLPGKKPLIKLSYRPPNYETPIEYFRTAITPNDAFFVRYHLSNIPEVDAKTWKVDDRWRRRERAGRGHPRRSQEDAGRSRSSPSTSARATGAACSSRT